MFRWQREPFGLLTGAAFKHKVSFSFRPTDLIEMRLAAYIEQHMEPILAKWENFASTLEPGSKKSGDRMLVL